MLLLLYPSACIAPPGTEFMHSRVRSTNTGAGAGGGGGRNDSGSTEISKAWAAENINTYSNRHLGTV